MNPFISTIVNGIKGAISGGGEGKLLSAATNLIDQTTYSNEEKAQMKLDLAKLEMEDNQHKIDAANKELELLIEQEKNQLADIANSRDANARIQESDKSSWMAKNIAYVLDVVFTVAFIAMLFVIIYKSVPETNKELFYTSFGLLGGYVSQILGFHRGTSQGSKDANKELRNLKNK